MNEWQWLLSLYQAHYSQLYRLATTLLWNYLGHTSDVQDVLQEVFLLAARHPSLREHSKPAAWLMSATRNVCLNYVRSNKRAKQRELKLVQQKIDSNDQHSPLAIEIAPGHEDTCVTLNSVQQALSQRDWQLLKQYAIEGRSIEDLAKEAGTTVNAMRVRIFRLREKVRKLSEDN